MSNLIAIIIFLGSLLGMGVILFRKISLARKLPLEVESPQENLSSRLKNRIRFFLPIKSFSSESFLHKLLSKSRLLTLKTESRIAGWQQGLREKAKRKREIENDNYWEELKKSTNQKDKNQSI